MSGHPDFPLIEAAVLIFGIGTILAFIFQRFQLPSVLAFILTGVLAGPSGLDLLHEEQIEVVAQIGIIFLLFIVGLELSIGKIKQLGFQAPMAGVLQLVFTTVFITFLLRFVLQFPWQLSFLLGSILSLSSTAIVLKGLEDNSETDTVHGRLILAILIIQDLFIVPLMTLVPALTTPLTEDIFWQITGVIFQALFFLAVALLVSIKLIPMVLDKLASTNKKEIFLLSAVLVSLGMAHITNKMGLSYEAGAFIAGLSLSGSVFHRQIMADSRSFRDIFMTLFFVSVGLLFGVKNLLENPGTIILVTLALVTTKWLAAYLAVRVLKFPQKTGLWTGFALFQVGEFSFILLGRTMDTVGTVPAWGQIMTSWSPILIDSIVLSMFLTPIVLRFLPDMLPWMLGSRKDTTQPSQAQKEETGQLEQYIIIAGYGPTAQNLAMALTFQEIPYTVVEMNANTVKQLQRQNIPCVYGDISHPDILTEVGIHRARALAITFPDIRTAEIAIHHAKQLNPNVFCMTRSRYGSEVERLLVSGADKVVYEELESSLSFIFNIMHRLDYPMAEVDRLLKIVREHENQQRPELLQPIQPVFGRFSLLGSTKIEWLELRAGSELVGKTLAQAGIRQKTGINVVAIIDNTSKQQQDPKPDLKLKAHDVLVVVGTLDQLHQLEVWIT